VNLEDYLKNNISNQKEIENTTSFYNNFNALSELYKNLDINNNQKILRAQGKYNAKIVFIFKDEQHLKDSIKNLEKIFNVYGIHIWDILILYQNKCNQRNKNIEILIKEILIVNPIIIYIFDDVALENDLLNNLPPNIIFGGKYINVSNIQNMIEQQMSQKIFDLFEYLITYNY